MCLIWNCFFLCLSAERCSTTTEVRRIWACPIRPCHLISGTSSTWAALARRSGGPPVTSAPRLQTALKLESSPAAGGQGSKGFKWEWAVDVIISHFIKRLEACELVFTHMAYPSHCNTLYICCIFESWQGTLAVNALLTLAYFHNRSSESYGVTCCYCCRCSYRISKSPTSTLPHVRKHEPRVFVSQEGF